MRNSGALALACAVLALAATAQAQYNPYTPSGGCRTIWDVLNLDGRLIALKNAVVANGLADTFKQSADITLFAPTNEAVAVCYQPGCLTVNTLLYHVIPTAGESALGLLSLGSFSVWQMANQGNVVVTRNAQGATYIKGDANTALVVQADIVTCGGGYVHIIDAVLRPLPPSPPPRPPAPSPPAGSGGAAASGCTQSAYDVISSVNAFLPFKNLIDRSGRAPYYRDTSIVATLLVPLNLNWPSNQPVIAYTQVDDAFTVNTHIIPNRVITSSMLAQGGLLPASLSGKVIGIGLGYDNSTNSNIRLNLDQMVSAVNEGFINIRGNSSNCQYIIQGIANIFWRQPDVPFQSPPSPPPPSPRPPPPPYPPPAGGYVRRRV